jgi:hypothetical protein
MDNAGTAAAGPGSPASATDSPGRVRPAGPTGPTWRFLISPRWLAWHAFAIVAFWGMCWLGDWQLHRALAGNALSWAYTFEWPIFALMGAVFWAKTIRDEFRIRRGEVAPHDAPVLPGGAFGPAGPVGPDGTTMPGSMSGEIELYDPELASYNAYLAKLNREAQ